MNPRAWRARSAAACVALAISGCELGRDRPTMPVPGDLDVVSDPSGATIVLDGRNTGLETPATVATSAGEHLLALDLLASSSELFVWRGTVVVPETAIAFVDAALVGGCFGNCPFEVRANRAECVIVGVGDFCSTAFNPNRPDANEWPTGSGNEYVSNLRVQVAGIWGPSAQFPGDTVTSLVYQDTWLGRSSVQVTPAQDVASFRYWSDPGVATRRSLLTGLEVDQRVIAPDSLDFPDLKNVVYFRFALSNISDDPRHQHWHPEIPPGGYEYVQLYAGMALDADIGSFDDDAGTYLPDSGVAFIYDLDLRDTGLTSAWEDRPPLVGLVWVETPTVARRPFSLWKITDDWDQGSGLGDDQYGFGYRVLSAQLSPSDPLADCGLTGDEIGHCADDPRDYRLSLTAGPIDLAQGESALFVMALVYAEPAPGTFTPGTALPPGDPTTPGRAIEAVADSLVARARRAVALWPQVSP